MRIRPEGLGLWRPNVMEHEDGAHAFGHRAEQFVGAAGIEPVQARADAEPPQGLKAHIPSSSIDTRASPALLPPVERPIDANTNTAFTLG
jgi:hypothetical protein